MTATPPTSFANRSCSSRVVVAGGLVDLAANFFYAAFDLSVLALAFDHRSVVLVDGDLLGLAEVADLNVLRA